MEQQQTDPWGQPQTSVQTMSPQTDNRLSEGASETTYPCPHCGEPLRPHHDFVGSLHCDNPECVQCCFLPPDQSSHGQVRTKLEAWPCPKATPGSGF
jgi:hypothetical protein